MDNYYTDEDAAFDAAEAAAQDADERFAREAPALDWAGRKYPGFSRAEINALEA